MSHANLVLFILIGVLCSTITSHIVKNLCGSREIWKLCEKCIPTCDSPGLVHCSRECATGCQCKNRYVRGPLGNCIDSSECPSSEYIYDNYEDLNV